MGPRYRGAALARIAADSLLLGGAAIRLMAADGTGPQRTVAARLGPGTFYLEPIAREGMGLLAVAAPGAAYAVHRVAADGRRHPTGLRMIAYEADPVPAGILADCTDLNTLPLITITGRVPHDRRAIAARIADALRRGLASAPGSVVSGVLLAHLRDLDHDEVMDVFEELRVLGRLGETLNLVRVREFRNFLHDRRVPWTFVFANWEPSAADTAAVFSGVLWGAGENLYQALEVLAVLAGAPFSEQLAKERHQLWTAVVTFAEHPVLSSYEGLRQLRDVFLEKLEQLEFFEAGRIIGQVVMTLLTLPEAVASVPKLASGAARLAVTVTRVGVALLDRIGLRFAELVKFLLSEHHAMATPHGIVLVTSGEDILVSGPKVKGTAAIGQQEVVEALQAGKGPLAEADLTELEEAVKRLDEAEKRKPAAKRAAAGAGAAMVTPEALEDIVAAAIAELDASAGGTGLTAPVRGTRLHSIVARLVRERHPAWPALEIVPERSLRTFTHVLPEVLDMPVETYVSRTAGVRELARELKPLFRTGEDKVRLIGDLKPDLVIRAPGLLVVWDLTGVQRAAHMAKNMLYQSVLRTGGEAAAIGETYWRHFGRTPAEVGALYPKELLAAQIQRAAARKIKEARGTK
ncbi:PD-(D/E)XK nuclease family protein [Streptomyces sp. 891-h]|uniref:PD-(D/E)XK nuclease family protein n=1 Tax=Streptomyces sp. 891-h TaxID=2720714 RepID=UPI001FA98F68|nr:PD-(D/E)XK nuclease family protein [Streptomyces sp. 891-h]UNZ21175.1 PD-(D/E)XK nuclease family protein [Streptomyces sp. 891-h]